MRAGEPSATLARKLARETAARKTAEKLLEQKSLELYEALNKLSAHLGQRTTQLEESEERSRKLVELVPDAIWVESGGRIAFVNDAAMRLLGAHAAADLLHTVAGDRVPAQYHARMAELTQRAIEDSSAPTPLPIQVARLDGSLVHVEVMATAIQYQNAPAVLVVARDISERKRHEAALEYQATHDRLTGLPNKALFLDRLGRAIKNAERSRGRIAVLFADLDKFKNINDTLGHSAGDELLQATAQRLRSHLRGSDTVARFGGDEFALLIDQIPDERVLLSTVERLVAALAAPVLLMGQQHNVTCSIGISMYPDDGLDLEDILKRADIAMYRAKESGRNTFQFFTRQMQERLDEQVGLEKRLASALAHDQFVLHYQPKLDLRSGAIVGLEALIRWQSPEEGLVPPGRFIPVAEKSTLILAIGEWVIQAAATQIRRWLDLDLAAVPVAVNVSSSQFARQRLNELVDKALRGNRLEAKFLGLELTESMSMDDPEASIAWMTRLKQLGVSLAIDDFGTGYSNLSYLKRFPVDALKIDRSFIQGLTSDPQSHSIVGTIVKLAHSLGLRVTAEGVETEGQVLLLVDSGCDEMQGYYFARPLPAADIAAMLRSGQGLDLTSARRAPYSRTALLVDDESAVLELYRRRLRSERVTLLTATSPAQAYEILAAQEVGVVVCDQRFLQEGIAAEAGVAFLGSIRLMYPRTIRILLTGDESPATLTSAINQAEVYRFVSKSAPQEAIVEALNEALQRYESLA